MNEFDILSIPLRQPTGKHIPVDEKTFERFQKFRKRGKCEITGKEETEDSNIALNRLLDMAEVPK
jgi:hypothetical protein